MIAFSATFKSRLVLLAITLQRFLTNLFLLRFTVNNF